MESKKCAKCGGPTGAGLEICIGTRIFCEACVFAALQQLHAEKLDEGADE